MIPILKDIKNSKKPDQYRHRHLLPQLKEEKNVFYMKADKRNKMMIADKQKYEEDVLKIGTGEGFQQVKSTNQLTQMIKEAKDF